MKALSLIIALLASTMAPIAPTEDVAGSVSIVTVTGAAGVLSN